MMSRIHDALKKAEEEKLAGRIPAQSGIDEVVEAPEPVRTSGTTPVSFEHAQVEHRPMTSAIAAAATETTIDTLNQRCTKVEWRPNRAVSLFLDSQTQVAPGMEEFRTLRSRLFQIRAKRPLKTILVSSALPNEGKSFVSGNLAQVFARQAGGRTLLIDCDLRKPQLHEMLGAPNTPGLSEYLRGKTDEFSIVQKSNYDDFFFIPGGQVSESTPELIGNGRLKVLLKQLGPHFSWIVVDSSPTGPVSDASRIAEFCDGVVLVVRAASTPGSVAELAKREFRDSPILGVVLNQVAQADHTYTKYYYGQYGLPKK
jgi:capsular exopolysaccharide synthesis family protein